MLRDVEQIGAPVGTRITVNRLYFNTPVRAKFLKGITTELSHCIDAVQRHALTREGVGFQFLHNDKMLLDIPQHATLKERVALIWGLSFAQDTVEIAGEQAGFRLRGVVGRPGLTRSQRSHQFFFMNRRPVVNRSLQFGFEDGYRGLVTIGRHPVGVILLETHPRFVDVNIHPTKKEIRFRDERAARDAVRDIVRRSLAALETPADINESSTIEQSQSDLLAAQETAASTDMEVEAPGEEAQPGNALPTAESTFQEPVFIPVARTEESPDETPPDHGSSAPIPTEETVDAPAFERKPAQAALPGVAPPDSASDAAFVAPDAMYRSVGELEDAPMQLFDTYLLVPSDDRLLIIDQHALHERLNYDCLLRELEDHSYASQQLAVPIVIEVAPSQVRLLESNLDVFAQVGVELEAFGGNTFQIISICHLYEDAQVRDLVYQILDQLAQGDLFDRDNYLHDILRFASRACKASVRAGDRLTTEERRNLIDGFRSLRPPYTCPHGRPIITELTQRQMEKSFRRVQ
jgi:DNA mismatch repair protein MutL